MPRLVLAVLATLVFASAAAAGDGELLRARDRYLPAATTGYAATPDGAQARYDAGRNLVEAVLAAGSVSGGLRLLRAHLLRRGRTAVARAEALDRPDGSVGSGRDDEKRHQDGQDESLHEHRMHARLAR